MSQRKILWLSHNLPFPPKTGVLQRNYNLLREVSRLGEIHLLAVFQQAILPIKQDLELARKELMKLCASVEIIHLPIDNSRVIFTWTALKSVVTKDPFAANWIKSPEMHNKVRRLVDNFRFDVAHFDTISLAVYKDDVGDVPSILNHHNIESELMRRRSAIETNPAKKSYYRMEARKLLSYENAQCPRFNVNFAVSPEDRDLLHRSMPDLKVEIVPNGVDTDYFRKTPGREVKNRLIFAGGMNWYPNRDAVTYFAREIWPRLSKVDGIQFSVSFVGASPPPEIVDLARNDSRVLIPGFVDDIRPLFDEAEIFICPMRDGGGTRLKILDAMAMEKPMVSTRLGCEGIAVEEGRHALLADDPTTFASGIVRLAVDAELRQRMAEEARRFVEAKFSWKVIGEKVASIYASL